MEDQTQSRLMVNGVAHNLENVQRIMKGSPKNDVKPSDIYPPAHINFAALIEPEQPKLNHSEVAFYEFEGKYIVLLGRETVRRAIESKAVTISGRIISKQSLKRCRAQAFVHPDEGKPARAPVYDRSDDEPPRKHTPKPSFNAPRGVEALSGLRDKLTPQSAKLPNHGVSGAHAPGYPKPAGQRPAGMVGKAPTPAKPVYTKDVRVEPGQDRPMQQYGQVDRVRNETDRTTRPPRPATTDGRPSTPNKQRRGPYGTRPANRQSQQ
jgi:hypothetical protein